MKDQLCNEHEETHHDQKKKYLCEFELFIYILIVLFS